MIFKQIFGKTVEAAMKSAKQIYGDDFTVFHTSEGNENQQPGISLIADKKNMASEDSQRKKKEPVYFERTPKNGNLKKEPGKTDSELQKLRKLAESQIANSESKLNSVKNESNHKQKKTVFKPVPSKNVDSEPNPINVYSRKSVRTPDPSVLKKTSKKTREKSIEPEKNSKRTRGLLSRFDESKPNIDKSKSKKTTFRNSEVQNNNSDKGEIEALHKRFDNLEALFYSKILSVEHEYVAHPIFQQLLQTGIPSDVISEWFKRVKNQSIHPFNESETFALEISKILKNALIDNRRTEPGKVQLFTGFSGSGKTSIIMKLMLHNDVFKRKKTAVLSILPEHKQNTYYTILEPFCTEHHIDYATIEIDSDLSEIHLDLDAYEQIFIDTPSLSVEKNKAAGENRKLKQLLKPLPGFDIHFTVNMAANFNDSLNLLSNYGSIDADFIALTHLDQVEHWGPVIPLFEKATCSGSYLSFGESITGSLKYFDAAWLTKNILE